MPGFNCNNSTWEPSWLSMYGWIYPATWAKSDNEVKNSLILRFGKARSMVDGLGPQTGEMQRLVAEWKEILESYDRSISYWEADAVLESLQDIYQEAQQQSESDRMLVAANKKPSKPVKTQRAPSSRPAVKDDLEDNEAFAAALGFNRATAKSPPKKVKEKARPYVPPTPLQSWQSRQRRMATECDNGILFGTHAVNQGAVLIPLGFPATDRTVYQYRVGPETSHVRIMKSAPLQFWTKGLSHDSERRANRVTIYQREGVTNRFVHVYGQRDPLELAAMAS